MVWCAVSINLGLGFSTVPLAALILIGFPFFAALVENCFLPRLVFQFSQVWFYYDNLGDSSSFVGNLKQFCVDYRYWLVSALMSLATADMDSALVTFLFLLGYPWLSAGFARIAGLCCGCETGSLRLSPGPH